MDSVSSVTKAATCTDKGQTIHTVSGTYDGFAYSDSRTLTDAHDFGDGRLTISLAYVLLTGESTEDLQVWHFNDDGTHAIEEYQYDGSKVIFSIGRLSYFSIMHVEPPANYYDDGGSNVMIFVGVGASAPIIVGISVFFLIRRKT